MKRLLICLCVVGLVFGLSALVMAASSVNQSVTVQVSTITEVSVSGAVTGLTVNAAVAGSDPTPATNASTTYNVTSNGINKKITGVLNLAMPTGITLTVTLASASATSAGEKTLSTTATDLVTAMNKMKDSAQTITYKLSATAAAGTMESTVKTVTFTIVDQ